MTRTSRTILIGLSVAMAGCGFGSMTRIAGSGHVTTANRSVSGFSKVSLAGTGRLQITQSGEESLAITADDNLMDYLTSDVTGGELHLGTKDNANLSPSQPIVYTLTVKNISDVDIAGAASLDAKKIDTDRLNVRLSGSGDMKIAGKAHRQDISIAGSGGYDGEELVTEEAGIHIAGSGSALVTTRAKLDVDIAGAGSVEYVGDPVVTQHVVGAGSIRKR